MNLNSVEKAYLHLSVALLCNSFVTVKNTFDTTFFLFLVSLQYPGIGRRGVIGLPAVKHAVMEQQLEHGHVTIPLQLMVGQTVLVQQI